MAGRRASADGRGAGGLRLFVPELDLMIADLLTFFRFIKLRAEHVKAVRLLVWGVHGRAIYLLIHLCTSSEEWAGQHVLVVPHVRVLHLHCMVRADTPHHAHFRPHREVHQGADQVP